MNSHKIVSRCRARRELKILKMRAVKIADSRGRLSRKGWN